MGWHGRILGRIRLVLVATGVVMSPTTAPARTTAFDSLDWITLTSERIALVRIEAVFDSVYPPRTHTDRSVRYRALRNLAGNGPARSIIARFVGLASDPGLGDTLLVLWQGEGAATSDTDQWVHHFPMSAPDSRSSLLAFATDFSLIRSGDSVLAAVERRLRMIKANRPLGDDRRWRLRDFMQGRGRLIYWIPEDREAAAVQTGSLNMLVVPADADRLPAILAESKSSDTHERAAAAWRLKEYPGPTAIARLREMLADQGVATMEVSRGGVTIKESAYIVRGQAYRALTAMGIQAPRPPGFESDSTYLETFVW